ncbi:MAG: hypothetical protein RMH93_05560 [Aquificaceae bacterium]|nr:hypothetical protein [Aquificaceae bacterium]MCS7196456.1 hypothetical protein [Aquificaceae bacterium]MDW8032995.1 hypothetical protein [Aquificaceae bacterium]MDW8294767.1 hypothetical protein [Aquificaceae bacterium]
MRDLFERIEELLYMQERLVNLLFISQSKKVRVSVNTAFDLLYHSIELLDLIEELLGMQETFQEEHRRDYSMNLVLEALSWMGIILPAIEDASPVFLQGIGVRGKEPLNRIRSLLRTLEEAYSEGDYRILAEAMEELQSFSSLLKYQIMLARKAYMNLA